MIRRFPLATRVEEAAIDAEVELELATLDICDQVRRCGAVGADSMWETWRGELTADISAAYLDNPARARRQRAEIEAADAERLQRLAEKYKIERRQAANERQTEAERRRREYLNEIGRQAAAERERRQAAEAERERDERWRRESIAAHRRFADNYHNSQQAQMTQSMMDHWWALVARKGWSKDEAATYWQDWLTGPPGFFG